MDIKKREWFARDSDLIAPAKVMSKSERRKLARMIDSNLTTTFGS